MKFSQEYFFIVYSFISCLNAISSTLNYILLLHQRYPCQKKKFRIRNSRAWWPRTSAQRTLSSHQTPLLNSIPYSTFTLTPAREELMSETSLWLLAPSDSTKNTSSFSECFRRFTMVPMDRPSILRLSLRS